MADAQDAFPLDPSESIDTDNDGIGNNADSDDNDDGYPDTQCAELNRQEIGGENPLPGKV
ncbi:MAG: hypothetical protein AB2805_04285 [Candidatus Thiodiazotropha sp.]